MAGSGVALNGPDFCNARTMDLFFDGNGCARNIYKGKLQHHTPLYRAVDAEVKA